MSSKSQFVYTLKRLHCQLEPWKEQASWKLLQVKWTSLSIKENYMERRMRGGDAGRPAGTVYLRDDLDCCPMAELSRTSTQVKWRWRKDKDEEWTCVADDSCGCEASVKWRWHVCIKPIRETHLSAYWSRLNIWMWHSSKRTSLLSNQNGEAGVYSGGMSLVSMVHSFAQHEGWSVNCKHRWRSLVSLGLRFVEVCVPRFPL